MQLDLMMITTSGAHNPQRTRRLLELFAVAILMSSAGAPSASAQASHNCLPPKSPDSTAPALVREAISILSETTWSEVRSSNAIPTGTAADVSIVQDNAVCNAAMSAFEARTGKQFSESFVIVRMGQSSPFYLMTPRRDGALTTRYLLDSTFTLIDMIGTAG
jgi:hypothetical protein